MIDEIGIKHISYYLPEKVRTNKNLVEAHGFDELFLRDKLGIKERRIADEKEATSDLAVLAGKKVLKECGLSGDEIECLVVVTQTPDFQLPHTAAIVQEQLGIRKQAASFDVSLGCSGYVYGLAVIQGFMHAQGLNTGLLLTAEEYSRIMADGDRSTLPLFGDGASATLLGRDPIYKFGKSVFGTDGSGADALIVEGSGSRVGPKKSLYMNGREIFNFMMTRIPENVDQCLTANNLDKADIDIWVFHQASQFMLQSLSKRMQIDLSKVVIDIEDIGNTTSSSIPIALARALSGKERMAEKILISGFGVGLSWATSVLYRNEAI